MYWLVRGLRFIRFYPQDGLLLGNEVILFEIAGIWSGNESSGHRVLAPADSSRSRTTRSKRSCARTS